MMNLDKIRVWRQTLSVPPADLEKIDWLIESLEKTCMVLLEKGLEESLEKE